MQFCQVLLHSANSKSSCCHQASYLINCLCSNVGHMISKAGSLAVLPQTDKSVYSETFKRYVKYVTEFHKLFRNSIMTNFERLKTNSFLYLTIYLVIIINTSSAVNDRQCPRFCKCDLYNERNRADCRYVVYFEKLQFL